MDSPRKGGGSGLSNNAGPSWMQNNTGGQIGNDTLTLDTKSRLEQKIEIVQQIMTMLEATMSTAKSVHQKKQSNSLSRIKVLQMEIDKIRQEMTHTEDYFESLTESLGGDIHKFMALDNILLTIDEGSKDDKHTMLPDLSNSDRFITRYLPSKEIEWHNLKLQSQKLNHETQHALMPNVRSRKFRLFISKDPSAEEQLRKVADTATALNIHRGKKLISKGKVPPTVQDVTLTWFANEISAVRYVEAHYRQIIQDVVGREYIGRNIDITEIDANDTSGIIGNSLTIHVQAKVQSDVGQTPGMPRTITLYQFDDTPYVPPGVTTFNVETASPVPVEEVSIVRYSKSPIASSPARKSVPNKISESTQDLSSVHDTDDPDVNVPRPAHNICLVPGKSNQGDKTVVQKSPVKELSSSSSIVMVDISEEMDVDIDDWKDYNDVKLAKWVQLYARRIGIENFTETQQKFLNSFHASGDINYSGVADGGKTTCTVLGILNNTNPNERIVQTLIITPNSMSSELVQKLVAVEEEGHVIVCQRVEELQSKTGRDRFKSIKRPDCHVLVGFSDQMKEVVCRNRLNLDKVRFLVLDRAEEIFATGKTCDILQILYSLNATIKVIVICRSTNASGELQNFCRTKLRRTLILEETVVVKTINKTTTHQELDYPGPPNIDRPASSTSSSDGSLAVNRKRIESIPTRELRETESENETDASSSWETGSNSTCISVVPQRSWTTFIPKRTALFLGLDIQDVPGRELLNVENVSHLYATLEGDDYKVEIIAQLDIEEDKTIIFCDTIERTEWLSTKLRQQRLWPQVLHEDVPRKDQNAILRNYREGSFCRVLIVTDFLTGVSLDVADVVLNFDIPKSRTVYLSRSKFATRKGSVNAIECDPEVDRKRVVVSLINENEHNLLTNLEESLGITIEPAYKDD